LGAAAAPAALAGYRIGVDKASGKDFSAFNFTCSCGNGIVAKVPSEVGEKISLDCPCGLDWELEWAGDRFKTKMLNPKPEDQAFDADAAQYMESVNKHRKIVEEADAPYLKLRLRDRS